MKFRLLSALTLALALAAAPAWALDLQSARASGAVGEQASGYVTALKPSGDVNALVASVNAARKQEYAKISQQNGQPVDVVGKIAAGQIVSNLPAGAKYQAADGSWKTR